MGYNSILDELKAKYPESEQMGKARNIAEAVAAIPVSQGGSGGGDILFCYEVDRGNDYYPLSLTLSEIEEQTEDKLILFVQSKEKSKKIIYVLEKVIHDSGELAKVYFKALSSNVRNTKLYLVYIENEEIPGDLIYSDGHSYNLCSAAVLAGDVWCAKINFVENQNLYDISFAQPGHPETAILDLLFRFDSETAYIICDNWPEDVDNDTKAFLTTALNRKFPDHFIPSEMSVDTVVAL